MPTETVEVRRGPVHRQARGECRRAALLHGLEEQLHDHALTDVSISEITRSAGLGRSAFYFYFPSKNAAVAELLVELYDELFELGSDLVKGIGPARTELAATIGHSVTLWRRHRSLFCAMLDAIAADPEVRPVWDAWIKRFEDLLVRIADEQSWPLALPTGVDLRATVAALLDTNQCVLERHVRTDGDEAAAAQVTDLLTHIWTATLFGEDAA